MNASNKCRIDEKSAAFIRGRRLITFLLILRRLFEGGVYSSEAFIRVITVFHCFVNTRAELMTWTWATAFSSIIGWALLLTPRCNLSQVFVKKTKN